MVEHIVHNDGGLARAAACGGFQAHAKRFESSLAHHSLDLYLVARPQKDIFQ